MDLELISLYALMAHQETTLLYYDFTITLNNLDSIKQLTIN